MHATVLATRIPDVVNFAFGLLLGRDATVLWGIMGALAVLIAGLYAGETLEQASYAINGVVIAKCVMLRRRP